MFFLDEQATKPLESTFQIPFLVTGNQRSQGTFKTCVQQQIMHGRALSYTVQKITHSILINNSLRVARRHQFDNDNPSLMILDHELRRQWSELRPIPFYEAQALNIFDILLFLLNFDVEGNKRKYIIVRHITTFNGQLYFQETMLF